MQVKQYGVGKADEVELRSYSEAARLDKFAINAGDLQATLLGTRLDEVAAVELNGIHFGSSGVLTPGQQRSAAAGYGLQGHFRATRRRQSHGQSTSQRWPRVEC